MPGQPLDLPLVGREEELQWLREARHLARMGPHGLLLLSGENGVFKSRLLKALGLVAEREGWTHAAGSAMELGQRRPFALLSGALAPLVRTLSPGALAALPRGTAEVLAALFHSLRPRAETRRGVDEEEGRTRVFWHVSRFLRRLAERSPLVLSLDPPHWTEAAALEVHALLVR